MSLDSGCERGNGLKADAVAGAASRRSLLIDVTKQTCFMYLGDISFSDV